MALITAMTLAEARDLGARFGLAVTDFRPIVHGSVNSNFELGLERGGRAFLRVYEESDRAAVERQGLLLGHLAARGVPTPAPLPSSEGGVVTEHRGRPVSAFPWCDGSWICQRRCDEPRLEQVGDALAAIHLAGAGAPVLPDDRFDAAALRERLASLRSQSLAPEIASAVARLGDALDEVAAAVAGYPREHVIHGDVFRDNVLWTDRLSAVLDFESASRGQPAFDLMVTMLAWSFGDTLVQSLARALVRGYVRRRPLEPVERAACWDEARMASIRFAITRITDYELRPRGVVAYKDYRRFLARLAAVEELDRDRFPLWLGL
jgi:homoserine kinase type II